MELNKKQKMFAREYIVDLNGTQAAIRAGYSEKTAYSQGQRLLKKAEIKAEIQRHMEKRSKRLEITQDRVLEEIAKIAFVNPKAFFDSDGRLKKIDDIDDNAMAAVTGSIDILEEYEGYGDDRELVGYTKKIKLADKVKALELLCRHLGVFNEKQDKGLGELKVNVVYGKPPGKEADENA